MDRVPCRVTADLRQHEADERGQLYDEADLASAHLDIVDDILWDPLGWRGHTLAKVIDEHLQVENPNEFKERVLNIAARLQRVIQPGRDREAVADLQRFLRELAGKYVKDEWCEQLATERVADDAEPFREGPDTRFTP